jgi:hypothetical protein
MKTIINLLTNEVLYCTFLEVFLSENEVAIEKIPTGQFYNFETKEFYDK